VAYRLYVLRRGPLVSAFFLFALLLACMYAARAQDTRSSWTNVPRVIAFGDVHGAYEDLTQLLRASDVVDKDLRWSAGSSHVVSLGDLLDRGGGSRKVMDLLMRLQEEASAAGGALHVVLGNHEAMNLLGDLRYVTAAEFASYANEEPAGLRERLRKEWIAQHGEIPAGQSGGKFDERFVPGYFGHRAAFSSDGKYGRWLLGLPVAIIIDDTVFMHGGPSKVLSGLSIEEINRHYRTGLSEYLSALNALTATGLVRIEDTFDERAALAQKRQSAQTATSAAAVRRFIDADRNPILNPDGPNWYRGAAMCNEVSESDVLKPLLEHLKVKRLVVGHTVTRNQRVASRFDGAVIKLDTGMNRAAYRGHPAALVIEKGIPRAVYGDEAGSPVIAAEPLFVTSPTIDDAAIALILARGNVTVGAPRAPGLFDVTVDLEGRRVPAVFIQASIDVVNKELAAHRLDRALQLGLVPATVKREVNGQAGILQARPARWVTQADVETQSLRPGGWCALAPQFELMYAFDAVIANQARTRERIVYDATEWNVLLTGHDRAFGTSKALSSEQQARAPQLGAEMRRRLATLDAQSLERTVGDLLNARERSALLARRDALLAGQASRAAER
jgi:hypothetical protein